jgi:hypothetical protein
VEKVESAYQYLDEGDSVSGFGAEIPVDDTTALLFQELNVWKTGRIWCWLLWSTNVACTPAHVPYQFYHALLPSHAYRKEKPVHRFLCMCLLSPSLSPSSLFFLYLSLFLSFSFSLSLSLSPSLSLTQISLSLSLSQSE